MTPIHFLSITIYSITKPTQYPRSYVIDNRFTWTVQSWHLGRAQGIPYTENHFHNGKTPEMIIHIAIAYTRCWRRWGGTAVNFSSGLLAFLCDGTCLLFLSSLHSFETGSSQQLMTNTCLLQLEETHPYMCVDSIPPQHNWMVTQLYGNFDSAVSLYWIISLFIVSLLNLTQLEKCTTRQWQQTVTEVFDWYWGFEEIRELPHNLK